MSGFLSDEELASLTPSENLKLHTPIPTQVVASDEFYPDPQNEKQREVEGRLLAMADDLGKKQGLDRRRFFQTTAGMAAVNAMYCPDAADLRNPLAAPLLADSHAGLPPAYVAVAEHDPLRDSGVAYAEALRRAGVPVTLDPGTGLIHSYLRAMTYCADVRRSFGRMCEWLSEGAA